MSVVVLKAEKREKLGSGESGRIKRSGRIPAVIYSKNGNVNLSLDAKEFEHEYFKGHALATVFELEIAGKKTKVIPHLIELDPVSDRPTHIDFFNCDEIELLRAHPKIIFVNQDKSPGIKKGGLLHVVLRKVQIVADKNSKAVLPEKIEFDVSSVHLGAKIRANDVVLPAGVRFAKKDNFLIASIIGRGKSEEEAAPAAGSAAPAAGAAGATPAAKGGDAAADKKPADKK